MSSIELAQMPLHVQVKTVFICDEMISKIKFKNTISTTFTKKSWLNAWYTFFLYQYKLAKMVSM